MSIPAVLLVLLLLGIPIGQAVYYSMTTWNGITATWIGPSTYSSTFSDPTFWRVLENNALLLLAVPFAILIPLGIAFLLTRRYGAGGSSAGLFPAYGDLLGRDRHVR